MLPSVRRRSRGVEVAPAKLFGSDCLFAQPKLFFRHALVDAAGSGSPSKFLLMLEGRASRTVRTRDAFLVDPKSRRQTFQATLNNTKQQRDRCFASPLNSCLFPRDDRTSTSQPRDQRNTDRDQADGTSEKIVYPGSRDREGRN